MPMALLGGCGDYGCWDCQSFPASEVSSGLVTGNFNGTGRASIVATSTVEYGYPVNAGNLKTYLSTGAGTFAAPTLTADGDDPLYLASADFNGDKLPDIVSASYSDGVLAVFLNDAQHPGTFTAPIVLTSPGASQVAIADMNGDGLPDLVSADFNVSLFLQTSAGQFASPISLYPGGANWVALGDLNGDGIADVALTDNVGVKILLHTGAKGSNTYATPVSVFTESPDAAILGANIVAIADVNGDGLSDLIITDPGPAGGTAPNVSVLLQDAGHPGQFLVAVTYATTPGDVAQSIVVTDVNGDGRPDIVIGGTAAVTVLLQSSTSRGTFMASASYPVASASEIAVADVNADGHPDILIATGPAQAAVNGVIPNVPGVLLQNPNSPGTFGSLQALP